MHALAHEVVDMASSNIEVAEKPLRLPNCTGKQMVPNTHKYLHIILATNNSCRCRLFNCLFIYHYIIVRGKNVTTSKKSVCIS